MNQPLHALGIRLTALEGAGPIIPFTTGTTMEFHVARDLRDTLEIDDTLFATTGNVVLQNFYAVRLLAQKMNQLVDAHNNPAKAIRAGDLNAMGLIDEILHYAIYIYRRDVCPDAFERAYTALAAELGDDALDAMVRYFVNHFPGIEVYRGEQSAEDWINGSTEGVSNKLLALEEMLLLSIANENPAFNPFQMLFHDAPLVERTVYRPAIEALSRVFETLPHFGPGNMNLIDLLKSPMRAHPYSLQDQLDYILRNWGLIASPFLTRILKSLDFIKEENKPGWDGTIGPSEVASYYGADHEYERFSPDKHWMPKVVMMAKSTLVWLHQLSVAYGREITRLDQIPDEEIDALAWRGFNALWLIGVWERSGASARIKNICGNPDAAPSAYSLFNYEIAGELGGWEALANLRGRCAARGVALAADMVPNHTGIDSDWIRHRPDLFLQSPYPPFPSYTFHGENLSWDPAIGVYLEDHYYNRSDAAVVFKRVDFRSGDTRYIYHGNDGTSMPWNDTAQIDFLNPEAREAVIQQILHVARNFPVIRFDAAMVLAKKHIRRLWYPEPGHGGDIASRAEYALSREEFDARIPEEFWREVVDRCAAECPDTLLLAEAFWMMEGYFVRTLGMHRVYNSAFMNMLKREENSKYRSTIKNTQEFDKDILKRFVNFMNNPDEETAVAQFGRGDKYFGVCTMMITMPGLPMFGHGQIEGFTEKYGMEYRRSYFDERPDGELIARHEREIFPVMRKRYLFAEVTNFLLYDVYDPAGWVNENVFAYSNQSGDERALVLFNNCYERASGWIRVSAAYVEKMPDRSKPLMQKTVAEAFGLHGTDRHFLIFREQRAGLWYIRTSTSVVNQGMFIMLNGFESQVYLDIHEVEDNAHAHFRTLHDHLNGAGVRDIAEALQDIFLKDLFESLAELFSAKDLRSLRIAWGEESARIPEAEKPAEPDQKAASKKKATVAAEKETPADIEAMLRAMRPRFTFFCRRLKEFMAGSGRWAAFDAGFPPQGDSDEAWIAFSASLRLSLDASPVAAKKAPAWLSTFAATHTYGAGAGATALLAGLRALLGAKASYADAARLMQHFHLDRKIRELTSAGDASRAGAINALIARLYTILTARDAAKLGLSAGLKPDKALTAFFDEPMFTRHIGANDYNGVTWFNKESFVAFMDAASFAAILDPTPYAPATLATMTDANAAAEKSIKDVTTLHDALIGLMEQSGFRLDELMKLVAPKPSKGKKNAVAVTIDAGTDGKKSAQKETMTSKELKAKTPRKTSTSGSREKKEKKKPE